MKRIALAVCLTIATAPALAEETKAPEKTAVDPALHRNAAPTSKLGKDDTAASASASAVRVSGAPVDSKAGQLVAVRGTTAAAANARAGDQQQVANPKTDPTPPAAVGKPQRRHAAVERVPDAPKVIASLGPNFLSCLTETDVNVEGPAVIGATIAPDGAVSGATVLSAGGASSEAVECFREIATHAKFAPMGPRAAVLQIHVSPRQLYR